ncbi:MAG: V0D/AC39 family V-type ATPase subunit [bacterium]
MTVAHQYAFLNGRVSAKSANLQSPERLRESFAAGKDERDRYLLASGIDPQQLSIHDPELLEQQLASLLMNEVLELARGLPDTARKFVLHFARRFELVNLKILLRCQLSDCAAEVIQGRMFDLGEFPSFDVQALLSAGSVEESLRLLEQTQYRGLVQQLRRVLAESKEVFLIEAAIDYGYFHDLDRLVRTLPEQDRKDVSGLVTSVIDQVNLIWLMRYRLGYGMTPPHAFFLLIRASGLLNRATLAKLAKQDSLEAMIDLLPGSLARLLGSAVSVSDIEQALVRDRLTRAYHILHFSSFNLARVQAYLIAREQQFRNIHERIKGEMLDFPVTLIDEAMGMESQMEAG